METTSTLQTNDATSKSRPLSAIGPDYSEAKTFLDIMHPSEKITFQTVPSDDAAFRAKILYGYPDDLWTELVDWNLKGANIFCMVNLGNGKGRSSNCVTAITGFFVSVRDAPVDRLDAIPIRPHLIVMTGKNSWQAHWKVIPKPVTYSSRYQAAALYRRVQMALATKVGGDRNLTDLARCCHVPGFFTYKHEPFRVELGEKCSDCISELSSVFPES